MSKTDKSNKGFASPACSMHELDTAWVTAADLALNVKHLRQAERERLIEARLALQLPSRHQHDEGLLAAHRLRRLGISRPGLFFALFVTPAGRLRRPKRWRVL